MSLNVEISTKKECNFENRESKASSQLWRRLDVITTKLFIYMSRVDRNFLY